MDRLAALAREAYATGWAATDAPMTPRVKAGCIAAMELARQHPGDPTILEATLQLGSLEGTWAKVYDRREKLYQQHIDAVVAAWRDWVADLDFRDVVQRFRRNAGLGETSEDDERRRHELEAAIVALLLFLFGKVRAEKTDKTTALTAAIEQALRDGEAEGQAGAVAIAAQQLGFTSVDFDRAYKDALAAAGGDQRHTGTASAVLDAITAAVAREIARRVAQLAAEAATEDAMVQAAEDTAGDPRAASAHTDWSMGQEMGAGMLTVFAAMNVTTVLFVTAGDNRVCDRCDMIEAQNPWPLLTVPQPAIHPGCRCTLEPDDPVTSLGRFRDYVLGG